MTLGSTGTITVFFSYAHRDEKLRNELEKGLTSLKRQGFITTWHDRKISAGKEWNDEINIHLNQADIILLLISPDFMASDYCDSVEVTQALKRHDAGVCRVIPIILRPTLWKHGHFSKLQSLPTDGKAVSTWSNRDKAFLDIAEGILKVITEISVHSEKAACRSSNGEDQKKDLSDPLPDWDSISFSDGEDELVPLPLVTDQDLSDPLPDWDSVSYSDGEDELVPLPLVTDQDLSGALPDWDSVSYSDSEESSSLSIHQGVTTRETDQVISTALTTNCPPLINIDKLTEKWEKVKRRVKTKKDGPKIAAILNGFTFTYLDTIQELPVLTIKATTQFHYEFLSKNDYQDIIKWALKVEMDQECKIMLLPPS